MADVSQLSLNGVIYPIKDPVARAAAGGPNIAATKSAMTDASKVYVYTGSESGMTRGNWYYKSGSNWVSGGVYQSTGIATDTTLTVSGMAADSKKVGDLFLAEDSNHANISSSRSEPSFNPDYTVITGYYIGTNNTINANASYSISSPIVLLPGQLVSIVGWGSSTAASMISITSSGGDPSSYVVAYPSTESQVLAAYLNTTDTIQYVRCTWLSAKAHTITIYNDNFFNPDDPSKIKYQSVFYKLDGTTSRVRFSPDWTVADYACSTPIHLAEGETIHLYGRAAITIPAVIKCDQHGGSRSFVLDGKGYTHHSYTATEDCYVMVQCRLNDAAIQVNKIPEWNSNVDVKDKRHGTVCFIFDDGPTQDSTVYNIFESNGFKCGFAIISSIVTNTRVNEYLYYQNKGYSILSHSMDAEGMNDNTVSRDTIMGKLRTSKFNLIRSGFDIRGFVTPSSQMHPDFLPLVDPFYDYAYTTYYGAYTTGSRAYNLFTDSPRGLWRLDMYSSTDNCKLAIDECEANGGFLTIYFHAASMQESHQTRLIDLLTYIRAKVTNYNLKCLAPNEAFDYYYSVRHEDVIG